MRPSAQRPEDEASTSQPDNVLAQVREVTATAPRYSHHGRRGLIRNRRPVTTSSPAVNLDALFNLLDALRAGFARGVVNRAILRDQERRLVLRKGVEALRRGCMPTRR
jgi:hypothetical protein